MSPIQSLLALAFSQAPAVTATVAIHHVREQFELQYGKAMNYEVVLDNRGEEYLKTTVAPRLALYLRSKSYSVKNCQPCFLSLFLVDTIFFIKAESFFHWYRQCNPLLDDEAFSSLTKVWEETGKHVAGALPVAPRKDRC